MEEKILREKERDKVLSPSHTLHQGWGPMARESYMAL